MRAMRQVSGRGHLLTISALLVLVACVGVSYAQEVSAEAPLAKEPLTIHYREGGITIPSDVVALQMTTNDSDEGSGYPEHFGWQQGLGVACACLGIILAAGGGIGGGGILVPVYIIVMQFSPKYGIPLSNITILGGAVANNWYNVYKRHPQKEKVQRPLIDYDLVLLMEPPTIAGAVVGSILNKVLPAYVITTLLVLVLGMTTIKTWFTGQKQWKKEIDQAREHHEPITETFWASIRSLCTPEEEEEEFEGQLLLSTEAKAALQAEEPEVQAILAEDTQTFPWWKIGAITLCFILVVIANVLKLAIAECGTVSYWVLMMAPVVITLGMMFIVRSYLLNKGKVMGRYMENLNLDGDIKWNETTTITYPLLCTLAGLFAGMFGIGGGIVKGPLMLEMGVDPQVSAATAAFMILYTAASATVTYAAFGQVRWEYSAILFPCGLVCTALGQKIITAYIKRTNHSSAIIFIIATIVGLATILMGFQTGSTAWQEIEDGVGLHDICNH